MIWLSWRQQRTETIVAAALLALLAAALIPTGIHLAEVYRHDHVAACIGRQTNACQLTLGSFGASAGFVRAFTATGWFNLVPGLIGIALAAPILLDLEHGTIRLAWTQSVTRRRWVETKFAVAIGTALLVGAAISLIFTWYRTPLDKVYGPFDTSAFDVEGTVPLAYILFALGLAVAIGVLWRRTAAAIVVAFCAFAAARIFVDSWLRQRFMTPLSATWGPHSSGPNLTRAWLISEAPSDKAGHPFTGGVTVLQHCSRHVGQNIKMLDPHCLMRYGAGYNHAVWQPVSRFWDFQGIETALFGGIAVLLLAGAATWLVRRPA